jgi:hypothetical protein
VKNQRYFPLDSFGSSESYLFEEKKTPLVKRIGGKSICVDNRDLAQISFKKEAFFSKKMAWRGQFPMERQVSPISRR